MKCYKCGYDDNGTGDTAHICGPVNMPRQDPSNLVKMWDDPRFQLLADLDQLLESSRVWGGMEWTYHPIHPFKYLPIKERVRKALDEVKAEYGVKE
jgi:hypothetical protein